MLVVCCSIFISNLSNDPRDLVAKIQRDNSGRDQLTFELANILRQPGNEEFKRDPAVVLDLAALLESEIRRGSFKSSDVGFRIYLCHVLGSFHIADGLPAILKAAAPSDAAPKGLTAEELEDYEQSAVDVRREAIKAVALLANNVAEAQAADAEQTRTILEQAGDGKTMAMILSSADDEHRLIQESAAFTLGVVGGDAAIEKLSSLLDSNRHPNVRYNAATGLSRHGEASAMTTVLEMLDPVNLNAVQGEEAASRDIKRAIVLLNGIEAASQLCQHNADIDRSGLISALSELKDFDFEEELPQQTAFRVRDRANEVLKDLVQSH